MTATQATLELAQRAYDIATVRFRSGLSTQLELDEAEQDLIEAQSNAAEALYSHMAARALLFSRDGGDLSARTALLALTALACLATPASAQDYGASDTLSVPPPSGIVPKPKNFAFAVGVGTYRWEDPSPFEAPFDDLTMTSLSIERMLWRGMRGRASMAAGKTTLQVGSDQVDAWVMPFDLQVVVAPDFGPFRRFGVMPYAVGGFGSLVTNPSGDLEDLDLTTRSQSQWTYGGGIQARYRIASRAESRARRRAFGSSDPGGEPRNANTQTVHNRRWEGRISWLF